MKRDTSQPAAGTTSGAVMIVDDEPNMCRILEKSLVAAGYRAVSFTDPRRALASLADTRPDIVLTDLLMPEVDGMAVLAATREHDASIPVIVLTAHGSIEGAVEAIKAGAFDFITKPFLTDELLLTLRNANNLRRLDEERVSVDRLWRRSMGEDEPVGQSAAWREVMDVARKVAPTSSPVLIQGETGVGKEMVARALHRLSDRAGGRFVPINCASIPEPLIESELFGHEKGAFTGADRRKMGMVELANHGTLFLDEIGELPLTMQAKLLRVIQDKRVRRVGAEHEIQTDGRVVVATNRDLRAEAEAGRFRQDLYFRLNVITLSIPPLRERPDDIPALTRHFLTTLAAEEGGAPPTLTPEAEAALLAYHWPGNARELRNVLERAVVLSAGGPIDADDLPLDLTAGEAAAPGPDAPTEPSSFAGLSYQEARDRFDADYVRWLLDETAGNVTAAARMGAMSRRNLYEKIEKQGIDVGDFKRADAAEGEDS